MNDKLNSFMTNLGVLCETWTMIYQKFVSQGMSEKEALAHTQGFMQAFMGGAMNYDGGKK